MELVKENITIKQVSCKGGTQVLVDEDIIVPDVNPDILKILQLDASSCVTGKEITDGRTVINGRVDLKILYIPDSEREKIKSIITSFDFTQNVDSQDIKHGMTADVASNVERAEFTLINSRKMRVKVVVGVDYEVIAEKSLEIAVEAADNGNTELRRENVKLQNCVDLSETDFVLKESAEVPGGHASVNEILKVDARVTDTEYKSIPGKIVAKGAVNVSVLYTDPDCKVQSMESEIPFTEVFECDDAGDETICDIDYCISEIRYSVQEDSDGDRRVIDLEVTVGVRIKATENVSIDMICDCYEPFMKTQLLKEEVELEEIISRPFTQNTIREMIETAQGAPGISGIYGVITRPYITKAQLQRGKLLSEGTVEAYILYLTDSNETPVYSMKKEIPFSYIMDCESMDDDLIPEIKAEVKHTAYNLNVAGEIELRCILALNANIIRKRKIELINDVVTEQPDSKEKKGIVIYFVQPGDNLWDVAKRYAVPQDEILRFNNMTEEDKLETGSRLFIPGI
ncbi:MAG: DUF3794 domain-containing protein [Oscillospiraceae bacterium]|nr:DUF3794 domain-containing protein [Oscillospiraceae bacterium]